MNPFYRTYFTLIFIFLLLSQAFPKTTYYSVDNSPEKTKNIETIYFSISDNYGIRKTDNYEHSSVSHYSWSVATIPEAPTATKSPNVDTVCEGQTLTLSNLTDNGGGTGNCEIEYRHSTDNGVTWTVWSTTPSSFAAVASDTNLIEIRKTCDGVGSGSSAASQYFWEVTAAPEAPTATKSPNVNTVCEVQTLTLNDLTDNGGGTGNCEIEYRHSTDNGVTWTVWSTTPSSFAAVASDTNLIEIRKTCDGENCGSSASSQYFWEVTTAPEAPTATKSPNVNTVCEGQTLTLSDLTDNGGGTGNCEIEYRHSTDNGVTWTVWSTTPSSFAAVASDTNLIEIRKTCDGENCGSSASSQYYWEVTAAPESPTATKSPNVNAVCEGQT
ncbi:MAG: hypothetical protein PHY85_08940, partial [Bacteroidales bacterium]|nr:hypothetical protein [Bacteroidales bacterium]